MWLPRLLIREETAALDGGRYECKKSAAKKRVIFVSFVALQDRRLLLVPSPTAINVISLCLVDIVDMKETPQG